jgi:hypothetical protein
MTVVGTQKNPFMPASGGYRFLEDAGWQVSHQALLDFKGRKEVASGSCFMI